MKKPLSRLTYSFFSAGIAALVLPSLIALHPIPIQPPDSSRSIPSNAPAYAEINLNNPALSTPISFVLTPSTSALNKLKPHQKIKIKAFVRQKGGKHIPLKDIDGKTSWVVTLNKKGEAMQFIQPARNNFSGPVSFLIDNQPMIEGSDSPCPILLRKVYEYRFLDGAGIRVHFTDESLERAGESAYFAKQVLDASVLAYQTIVDFQGFASPGYTFANPNKQYAYDPDATFDIYLGLGRQASDSKEPPGPEAPFFETLQRGAHEYEAMIFIPAHYRAFMENWERLNPSPLGRRQIGVDLQGTLVHEMLHAILFYYNKNINRSSEPASKSHADWYVEGLARYFEFLAGARHDFFSQGFKQTLATKIRFSRGGANYLMRYPDQPFTALRYENALFWRFVADRYGMSAIERLSRELRRRDPDPRVPLEIATGTRFNDLLKRFALAMLQKDFHLREDQNYLKSVARTSLVCRDDGFWIEDGFGQLGFLGKTCQIDWIGSWDGISAPLDAPSVAGDTSKSADISPWATDFFEIRMECSKTPLFRVILKGPGRLLGVQAVVELRGGSTLIRDLEGVVNERTLDVNTLIKEAGLDLRDVSKINILVTNLDPQKSCEYEIRVT